MAQTPIESAKTNLAGYHKELFGITPDWVQYKHIDVLVTIIFSIFILVILGNIFFTFYKNKKIKDKRKKDKEFSLKIYNESNEIINQGNNINYDIDRIIEWRANTEKWLENNFGKDFELLKIFNNHQNVDNRFQSELMHKKTIRMMEGKDKGRIHQIGRMSFHQDEPDNIDYQIVIIERLRSTAGKKTQ